MLNDEELCKLSVSELQDLAVTNPPNLSQIVIHLNRRAINRPVESIKLTEYQAKLRAIGPGSWFYNYMYDPKLRLPKAWDKYLNNINKKKNNRK